MKGRTATWKTMVMQENQPERGDRSRAEVMLASGILGSLQTLRLWRARPVHDCVLHSTDRRTRTNQYV
jgi:hypothetical protein